jgi:excisionase family DNA binding protein
MRSETVENLKKPEKLLRAREVGPVINSSTSMAYKLMAARVLPTVRIGRSVRVPERALEAWIAANTEGGEVQLR